MNDIKKIIIITDNDNAISNGLSAALGKLNIEVKVFRSHENNNVIDKYIFHAINHQLHNFRIVPKSRDVFQNSKWSHKNFRAQKLSELVETFNPELLFHIRGIAIKPETLLEIRKKCLLLGWWVEGEHRFDEIQPLTSLYDHFYFFSSSCVNKSLEAGQKNVSLLPHAIDLNEFYQDDNIPEKYDWVFVGGWSPVRQAFIEGLAEVSDRFVLYGPRWKKNNILKPNIYKHIQGQYIYGKTLNQLYSQSKVVLNITQWGHAGKPRNGMNMRVLETLACGACLLSDVADDTRDKIIPFTHFAPFEDVSDAKKMLATLLSNDELAQNYRENGLRLVRGDMFHYDEMAQRILRDAQKSKLSASER